MMSSSLVVESKFAKFAKPNLIISTIINSVHLVTCLLQLHFQVTTALKTSNLMLRH